MSRKRSAVLVPTASTSAAAWNRSQAGKTMPKSEPFSTPYGLSLPRKPVYTARTMTNRKTTALPDRQGRFGSFGGRYVPETLMPALLELEREYAHAKKDARF